MSRLDDPVLKRAVDQLNYAGPDETGVRMIMFEDLMAHQSDLASLERAVVALEAVNADETISNADIKGLLNRASAKTWGVEYHREFEPREFVAELKRAVTEYLRRHPQLR